MGIDKEIEKLKKDIIAGKKGLMPIEGNKVTIVWVAPCGYGRMMVMKVTDEGRKEFEEIMKLCDELSKTLPEPY